MKTINIQLAFKKKFRADIPVAKQHLNLSLMSDILMTESPFP